MDFPKETGHCLFIILTLTEVTVCAQLIKNPVNQGNTLLNLTRPDHLIVLSLVKTMAKDLGVPKYDPNTEAFQMRAQWKKVDICRKQWFERWSWLLEERQKTLLECDAIRQEAADALPHGVSRVEMTKLLKPVPVTSTGVIGWLAAKPDCQLEIYTSWLTKIPVRLPDVWDDKNYL